MTKNCILAAPILLALCVACSTQPRQRAVVVPSAARATVVTPAPTAAEPAAAEPDEVDLVPPVPTFTSVAECELAYGSGQCGSGAAVYESARLDAPPNASTWFIPFAYGAMTGVLVNRYFSPPAVYVSTVEYRRYVVPVVVERYRVVDHRTIEVYRRAPVVVRNEVVRAGPVRYSPARGAITSPFHAIRAENPGTTRPPTSPRPQASTASTGTPSRPSPTAVVAPSHPQPTIASAVPRVSAAAAVSPPLKPPPVSQAETKSPRANERPHSSAPVTASTSPAAPLRTASPPAEKKAKPCNPSLPKSAFNCAA